MLRIILFFSLSIVFFYNILWVALKDRGTKNKREEERENTWRYNRSHCLKSKTYLLTTRWNFHFSQIARRDLKFLKENLSYQTQVETPERENEKIVTQKTIEKDSPENNTITSVS